MRTISWDQAKHQYRLTQKMKQAPERPFRWDDETYNVMNPLPAVDPIAYETEWSGWTLRRKALRLEDNV